MFSYCQSSQQTALGPEGSAYYYSNNKHTADNGHVVEVLGSMKAPITIYKPTTIPDIAELQLRGIFFSNKSFNNIKRCAKSPRQILNKRKATIHEANTQKATGS